MEDKKVLLKRGSIIFIAMFCLLSILLTGCRIKDRYICAARPFPQSDIIKLMSFNIRYGTADDGQDSWEYRKEFVFDVICGSQADIVGLQEALYFQINDIRCAMSDYGRVGLGRDNGRRKGEFCGILYRTDRFRVTDKGTFWLSNMPWMPGSYHWGNEVPRICTWARFIDRQTGKGFYVYNLHLDHQSQASREKSVELLAKMINKREYNEPFIVMGDFNAGEDNPAIAYLEGQPLGGFTGGIELTDTFRTIHPNAESVGTYHSFKGDRSGEKIDYIFVGPGTQTLDANIIYVDLLGRYPSDHFPVTAEIRLF